ncbi:MAG: hypothetical protein DRG73_07665, partial [Deltaproteobacteria bacterium]
MLGKTLIATMGLFAFLLLSGCIAPGDPYQEYRSKALRDRILVPEMPSTREDKPGKKVSPAPVPD